MMYDNENPNFEEKTQEETEEKTEENTEKCEENFDYPTDKIVLMNSFAPWHSRGIGQQKKHWLSGISA